MPTDEEKRLAGDIETLTEGMANIELVSAGVVGPEADKLKREYNELKETFDSKTTKLKQLVGQRMGEEVSCG